MPESSENNDITSAIPTQFLKMSFPYCSIKIGYYFIKIILFFISGLFGRPLCKI